MKLNFILSVLFEQKCYMYSGMPKSEGSIVQADLVRFSDRSVLFLFGLKLDGHKKCIYKTV